MPPGAPGATGTPFLPDGGLVLGPRGAPGGRADGSEGVDGSVHAGSVGSGDTGGEVGTPTSALSRPIVLAFWGQDNYATVNPADTSHFERPLAEVCAANPHYDAVIIGFIVGFAHTRNANGVPEMNFSIHCTRAIDAADPYDLSCPDIVPGIDACQKLGKKVLLGLGGVSSGYGFAPDTEAQAFADTTWNMFLGGTSSLRPFGTARLDGVDLHIVGGTSTGYAAYARRLRQLAQTDPTHAYWISAAPGCVYPDARLGPGKGLALDDALPAFDFLTVQFYDNPCQYDGSSSFIDSFNQWASLSTGGRPKIVVGLPASPQAFGSGFVDRTSIPALAGMVRSSPAFGGVALWDESFDQNSGVLGQTFGAYVSTLIR